MKPAFIARLLPKTTMGRFLLGMAIGAPIAFYAAAFFLLLAPAWAIELVAPTAVIGAGIVAVYLVRRRWPDTRTDSEWSDEQW